MDLAFSMVDYAIFGIMLIISFGIGVYHATKNTKNNEEFVMGSRSFSVIPMAISLCASFNSAYMILGKNYNYNFSTFILQIFFCRHSKRDLFLWNSILHYDFWYWLWCVCCFRVMATHPLQNSRCVYLRIL